MKPMQSNVAFIIKNIQSISGDCPGKKTLQKLVFLIEQKGIDLGCEYGLHFYGPYSAVLDAAASSLDEEGIISFDYSGYSHRMSVNPDWDIKSEVSEDQEKTISDVLTRYKDWNPSKLELLTTAIYAYDNLQEKTRESVIGGVKKIKGSKYSQDEINNVIQEFSYFNKEI